MITQSISQILCRSLLTVACGCASHLIAQTSSSFTSDRESWMAVEMPSSLESVVFVYSAGTPYTPTWSSANGAPAGSVAVVDPSSGNFYFQAPSAYIGNISAYYGGTITWDLRITGSSLTVVPTGADLVLI